MIIQTRTPIVSSILGETRSLIQAERQGQGKGQGKGREDQRGQECPPKAGAIDLMPLQSSYLLE